MRTSDFYLKHQKRVDQFRSEKCEQLPYSERQFSQLEISACVNFEAEYIDLKEIPMSSLLLLTTLNFEWFNQIFGYTKYTFHAVIFKTSCETLPFRTLLFIFQTDVHKFCTLQNAKINKCLPRCFRKGPF